MERIVEKTKTQAEDAHRILVKARNGLAAVCIIRERWAEAVEHYRYDSLRLPPSVTEQVYCFPRR